MELCPGLISLCHTLYRRVTLSVHITQPGKEEVTVRCNFLTERRNVAVPCLHPERTQTFSSSFVDKFYCFDCPLVRLTTQRRIENSLDSMPPSTFMFLVAQRVSFPLRLRPPWLVQAFLCACALQMDSCYFFACNIHLNSRLQHFGALLARPSASNDMIPLASGPQHPAL